MSQFHYIIIGNLLKEQTFSIRVIDYYFNKKKKHRSSNRVEKRLVWKCLSGENRIIYTTFECDIRASLGN